MTLLKEMRLKKGLTQTQVAELIGIKIRHYQNVEAGISFLTQEKLNNLEDIFETPQRILLARSMKNIPNYYKPFKLQIIEESNDTSINDR